MTEPTNVTAWTHRRIASIADEHFPGSAAALEANILEQARRHEDEWRSTTIGNFRPTSSMYALALGWELARQGPTCGVCHQKGEVSLTSNPSIPRLILSPRVRSGARGLNVPQNLSLQHEGCGGS